MRTDPLDFGLKLGDTRAQLVARITVEALAAQQTGSVSSHPGAVVIVHCSAASDALRLLSTGLEVRGPGVASSQQEAAAGVANA